MIGCEFEGIASYDENKRKTRCQQENERWQEVIFSHNELHYNNLTIDSG